MDSTARRTAGTQSGPRAARVLASVRAATLAELSRVGLAGLTMDAVAREAGVHRSTLYRRWPSKDALLTAVVEPLLSRYDAILPSGSLYADLFALMAAIRDNVAGPEGQALFAAVGQPSAELGGAVQGLSARTLHAFRRLLIAAQERGEIGPAADVDAVAHLAFHGVGMWELSHGSAAGDEDLHRILRTVLAGFPSVCPP